VLLLDKLNDNRNLELLSYLGTNLATNILVTGPTGTNDHSIEPEILRSYLKKAGYSDDLASRAFFLLEKGAHISGSLYGPNKAVYHLLRYGV
jgi:hypothetical protein